MKASLIATSIRKRIAVESFYARRIGIALVGSARRTLSCVLLLMVVAGAALQAQEYRGTILGRVVDSSGAVIPSAKITAKGPQQTYTTTSSKTGDFTIPFVQPGTYDVTVDAQGFKKTTQTGVIIDAMTKANLSIEMQVGAANETINVESGFVGVNTADASGGTVMDPEKVQNLPLNGRQVYMLLTLTPGFLFTTSQFGPSGNSGTRGWDQTNAYQINGVVNNQNQFLMNGAPISQQTSTARGGWFISPNVDAVQEFKVQTNAYDATIGRSGGGTVNVVTKQGTNSFHGTVFDYWRNSAMDANFWQVDQVGAPCPNPTGTFPVKTGCKAFHNQHQFGGTFGGPIKHNKTYFFGSFEGWREVLPVPVITTVPAGIVVNSDGSVDMSAYQAGIARGGGIYNPYVCATTNADGSCATRQRLSWQGKNDVIPPNLVSSVGMKILRLYPQPNQPGIQNNLITSSGGRYKYNQPIIRVDHNFTDKTRLYGMYSWWSGTEFRNTSGLPDLRIATGNINNYRSFQSQILDFTHIFSPALVFDIRASLARAKDRSPDGGLSAGLAKLTPADLGLTTYPVPPTTNLNLAPQIQNDDPAANIIGNRQFSDFGHPPLNVTYETSPSITQTKGKHNLRYGGQFMQIYAIPCCRDADSQGLGIGAGGRFHFGTGFTQYNPNNGNADPAGVTGPTGSSFAAMVMGIPDSGNIPTTLSIYEGYPYYALYFQDDWKVKPNLTLNLGLRWDVELSPDERYNRLNGGFDYQSPNPINSRVTFPTGNVLVLPNGSSTGLTMPNPVVGGFTFIGHGRAPYDTEWNHWAPRLGVSWAPYRNGKTVIRGGYGVNYGFAFELGGNTTYTALTNYVSTVSAASAGHPTGSPNPAFLSGNPYGSSDPNSALVQPAGPADGLLALIGDGQSYDQRNRKITRVQNYSLGLQQELPFGVVLDMSYVGTYTSNIRVGVNYDALTPAQIAQCAASAAASPNGSNGICTQNVKNPFFHTMNGTNEQGSTLNNSSTVAAWVLMESFPQFNQTVFSNTEPFGWGDYNSMQVKVNKRFTQSTGLLSRGLSFLSSFTWAKNMVAGGLNNNNNGQCRGCVDSSGPGKDKFTPFVPKPFYQLDSNDRKFLWAVSGIYGLPIGKGGIVGSHASGMLAQLVDNWSIEGIYNMQSGRPISLSNTTVPTSALGSLLPTHRTFNEWLNNECPSCWVALPNNTFIPRPVVPRVGYIRGYSVPNLNFGITKGFGLAEHTRLEFKAEAFNALNTPSFGDSGTGSAGTNNGGQTTAIRPVFFTDPKTGQTVQKLPGQPGAFTGYGTIGATQNNFPRQIQLSMKVLF